MKFENKVYDTLKYVAQVVLPSVGTLYFALAGIWGLPLEKKLLVQSLRLMRF